jgi:hypothetical protein
VKGKTIMKKKIASLFIGTLVALVMMMPAAAEETPTEAVEDVTAEIVTDTTEVAAESAETVAEETETAPEAATEAETAVQEDTAPTADEWEAFKAKITDTATWTMIGAALMTILTTVGTVKSNFDKISSLVGKKADDETLRGALKDAEKELKEIYNEKHDEIAKVMQRYEDALKNFEANEQKLYAILTLFMTNCKISESAKAEILNILADVKKYEGDVGEVVAQAQEAINEAIKDAEENSLPTPTLDQMLEEGYMELG